MMWDWTPWWHWLSMAGIWLVGIGVIVWVITTLFTGRPHHGPQQILDERFARGEIDVDEYRRRRHELRTHGRPADHAGT